MRYESIPYKMFHVKQKKNQEEGKMKQYTVRLEDADVEQLDELMKEKGFSGSQKAFEWMVKYYLQIERSLKSCETCCEYWQEQHDSLSAEYQRLSERSEEKIKLLREIIEEGLGRKVI